MSYKDKNSLIAIVSPIPFFFSAEAFSLGFDRVTAELLMSVVYGLFAILERYCPLFLVEQR